FGVLRSQPDQFAGRRQLELAAGFGCERHRDVFVFDQPARPRGQVRKADHDDDGAGGMRSERGQAVVLAVMMMTSFLGMAALVLDTGSWFRERRPLHATAAATPLAGAQPLPVNPGTC